MKTYKSIRKISEEIGIKSQHLHCIFRELGIKTTKIPNNYGNTVDLKYFKEKYNEMYNSNKKETVKDKIYKYLNKEEEIK